MDQHWKDLGELDQAGVRLLGWNPESWDEGDTSPMEGAPSLSAVFGYPPEHERIPWRDKYSSTLLYCAHLDPGHRGVKRSAAYPPEHSRIP